jgi:hypothetical protein
VLSLRAAVFDIEEEDEYNIGVLYFRRCCHRIFCSVFEKHQDHNKEDDYVDDIVFEGEKGEGKEVGNQLSFHSESEGYKAGDSVDA